MDHYYDKLLQIARFDADVVKNAYLCQEASKAEQTNIFFSWIDVDPCGNTTD
jgi:hypothetical protein